MLSHVEREMLSQGVLCIFCQTSSWFEWRDLFLAWCMGWWQTLSNSIPKLTQLCQESTRKGQQMYGRSSNQVLRGLIFERNLSKLKRYSFYVYLMFCISSSFLNGEQDNRIWLPSKGNAFSASPFFWESSAFLNGVQDNRIWLPSKDGAFSVSSFFSSFFPYPSLY